MATKGRAKKATRKTPVALHTHILASFTSTSHHKHSGKKLHSRHSSYGFLLLLLMFTGVLLFANLGTLRAFGVSQNGSVGVTVNVAGIPPTQGAVIGYPQTNTQTTSSLLEVSGTCPHDTLVSIYNNGDFVGSTLCTVDDTFAIVITLTAGYNIIQAQNYDGLNQPGPVTAQHVIFYQVPVEVVPSENPVITNPQTLPLITNPQKPQPEAPQPDKNPCYVSLDKQSRITANSKTPVISLGCVHRNIYPGEELTISYLVNGGVAPYAVNVDWEDGSTDLKSITNAAEQKISHTFSKAGNYEITFYTTDAAGNKSQIQSVVIVNGDPASVAAPTNTILKDIQKIWLEAPIPLYIAAATLALGFWIGDIFQRFISSSSHTSKPKRRQA